MRKLQEMKQICKYKKYRVGLVLMQAILQVILPLNLRGHSLTKSFVYSVALIFLQLCSNVRFVTSPLFVTSFTSVISLKLAFYCLKNLSMQISENQQIRAYLSPEFPAEMR